MTSSSPPANIGPIDLESVLNVRRRTLASIGETTFSPLPYQYTDTVYLKRETNSNSLFSIQSKIVLQGELHFLYSLFERYTSNIIVPDESIKSNSNKGSFSETLEEDEPKTTSEINSTLRQTSISSQSTSSIKRQTTNEYSNSNLDGKRYGCIQLPNISFIEILEILLRNGLEILNQSSDYDPNHILHQTFLFSKLRSFPSRSGQTSFSRSSLFTST